MMSLANLSVASRHENPHASVDVNEIGFASRDRILDHHPLNQQKLIRIQNILNSVCMWTDAQIFPGHYRKLTSVVNARPTD